MVDSKADLNLLYKRLNDAIKADSDEEILRLSEQILCETPTDFDINLCKYLSLVRLNKYEAGLAFLQNLKVNDPLVFYSMAYCHYKLNHYPQCLELINKSHNQSINHPGFQLLEAQIYYKQEKYEDSFKIYQSILEKAQEKDENYEDLLVNMLCSGYFSSVGFQEKAQSLVEAFLAKKKEFIREVLFNLSLIYAALGQYESTFKTLKRFEGLIESEIEGDQQNMNDLLMSQLETDYIESQIYGFSPEVFDEKVKVYMNYESKENLDATLKLILTNNLIYFKSQSKSFHSNYHENLKSLDILLNSKQKMNKTQEITLKMNKILLALNKNKLVEAQKNLSDLEAHYSKEELRKNMRFIIAKFFLLYKSKNFKAIEGFFNELLLINNDPTLRTTCHFIKAEINRLQHRYLETFTTLKTLLNENPEFLQNEPFCLMLFSLASQNEATFNSLKTILQEISLKSNSIEIQSHCAEVFLKKEEFQSAAQIFEKILAKLPDKENSSILFKLLQCYSVFDTSKAENLLHKIPLPEYISEEKELKKLLDKDNGFGKLKQPGSPKSSVSPKNTETLIKKTIKKKKKRRLPKNFDPKNPGTGPDPERWLPIYQRAKGKKGKKKGGRGAQGEVSGKETVNAFKSAASTANQEISIKKAVKSKKKRK